MQVKGQVFFNFPKIKAGKSVKQANKFELPKSSLKPGKILVCADSSENYAFVLQDAAQSFHWNNAQATLHPFVIYYKESDSGELQHLNFVVISDCMNHDTIAVHLFQRKLISFLKQALSSFPTKIAYFSDGGIRIGKISLTYAVTKRTLVYRQNGTSQQLHTERVHVTDLAAL